MRVRTVRPDGLRGLGLLALACVAAGVTGTTSQGAPAAQLVHAPLQAEQLAAETTLPGKVVAVMPAAAEVAPAPGAAAIAIFPILADAEASDEYYGQLRAQLRWKEVRVGARKMATPDARSRLLLAKSAAEVAELGEVGLDFRDVYGVINAETTWVPRSGMGKNGVASIGLAQFEPATAKAVGLRNPNDAVEAVHAAAVLLKEAANWSRRRIASLDLSPEMRAVKLREGVSIYYNLSSRARRGWSGVNTHQLPLETRRHIRNVRVGAQQAGMIYARMGGTGVPQMALVSYVPPPVEAAPVQRVAVQQAQAKAQPSPARKQAVPTPAVRPVIVADRAGRKTWVLPQGSIAWSGPGNG
ncbi:MAG: hypothetical protein JWP65_3776 [Ramlibacter sp.]|uniref:hypothetical protein n=1 Tax=Ramlibacter sp. TaxID=1917967 RepID=UPI00261D2FF8|nr:hypothetical protein [Ramlibacter sp.]MDB5753355.1 hypothetical protein [Ramlibacter sp.]